MNNICCYIENNILCNHYPHDKLFCYIHINKFEKNNIKNNIKNYMQQSIVDNNKILNNLGINNNFLNNYLFNNYDKDITKAIINIYDILLMSRFNKIINSQTGKSYLLAVNKEKLIPLLILSEYNEININNYKEYIINIINHCKSDICLILCITVKSIYEFIENKKISSILEIYKLQRKIN